MSNQNCLHLFSLNTDTDLYKEKHLYINIEGINVAWNM